MAITITDMRLCAGGNHVIFTAVDENGKDASFSRDVADLSPEEIPSSKTDHEVAMEAVVKSVREAGAVSFEDMKAAVVKGGKV